MKGVRRPEVTNPQTLIKDYPTHYLFDPFIGSCHCFGLKNKIGDEGVKKGIVKGKPQKQEELPPNGELSNQTGTRERDKKS